MDLSPFFFRPAEEIHQVHNRLPHWHQPNAIHFITFRLVDSIPAELLRDWKREEDLWRARNPEPWSERVRSQYWSRFHKRKMDYLDEGRGACLLMASRARGLAAGVFGFFEGMRHENFSWVIMPNHVHILSKLLDDHSPSKVIATWKKESARQINADRGKSGSIWAKDYFDTIVRSEEHFENCVRYIRRNPVRAGLNEECFTLFESLVAKDVQ